MKKFLIVISLLFVIAGTAQAQTLLQAEEKFHKASQQYINNDLTGALASVKEGLHYQPNSEKLEALRKILEQEQKKQDQKKEQEKKDQQKQDQQNKDQQNKDKENQEQKDKDKNDQEKKDQEKKDEDKKDQKDSEDDKKKDEEKKQDKKENEEKNDQEKKDAMPKDISDKLKEMKISEEKARMILEAMKNQEVQYLQQNKRKATKPREKGKPDW